MNDLFALNAIFLGFMAVVWGRNTWHDVFIKVWFVALTGANLFFFLELNGFVVHV